MNDSAGNRKEYNVPFQLSEVHLRKIYSVMYEYSNKTEDECSVRVSIYRNDQSFYETSDLNNILDEENINSRAVKSIELSIVTYKVVNGLKEKEIKSSISFNNDKIPSIQITTSHSSRDWCALLFDELDLQVNRVIHKPFLKILESRIANMVIGLLIMISLMSLLLMFSSRIGGQKVSRDILNKSIEEKITFLVADKLNANLNYMPMFLFVLFLITFLMLYIIEFRPINRIHAFLNTSCFYWGDMILFRDKQIKKYQNIKWGIFISLIISVISGIITAKIL